MWSIYCTWSLFIFIGTQLYIFVDQRMSSEWIYYFLPSVFISFVTHRTQFPLLLMSPYSFCSLHFPTNHQESVPVANKTLHSSDIWTSRGRAGEPPRLRWAGRSWRPSYSVWSIWCHWTSRVTSCWTTAQFHTLKKLWVGQGGQPAPTSVHCIWTSPIQSFFISSQMNSERAVSLSLSLFQHRALQEQHLSFPGAEEAPAVSGLTWHHPL